VKKTTSKSTYRIRNWSDYNKSLCQRGSLEVWIERATLQQWYETSSNGSAGRPRPYSDTAILTTLPLASVFSLPLRAAQGLLTSILAKIEYAPVDIPNYTTLCRRRKSLDISLPRVGLSTKPLHLVVDSTGLKVFGDGEWKVRQHGISKRRIWRKLHLAVDSETQSIAAAILTGNEKHDGEILTPLLDQISEPITAVYADGAYDHRKCYATLLLRKVKAIIPPRRNARIWRHGNTKAAKLSRDQAVRRIRGIGRKGWKVESGYHRRSLAETAMYRMKTIFGSNFRSRLFASQQAEAMIRCRAMNMITRLGMPETYIRV
jgi:hypothetical protein